MSENTLLHMLHEYGFPIKTDLDHDHQSINRRQLSVIRDLIHPM